MQSTLAGPYQWVFELRGLQMFGKNSGQELVVCASLGIVLLFLNWGSLSRGTTSRAQLAGLLIGLFGGFVDICLVELSRVVLRHRSKLRYTSAFLALGLTVVLAAVSRPLAYGYFSGLGISFCFGLFLATLLRRLYELPKESETKSRRGGQLRS